MRGSAGSSMRIGDGKPVRVPVFWTKPDADHEDNRMDTPADVSGKRMIVTGATDGIGRAAVRALAAAGAELTIVARNPAKARATVAEIAAARPGGQVDVVIADLSVQADVRRAAAEIASRYPRIDV